MVETMKLGFIGTGNMASAIMGGIIRNEVIPAEEIIGADLFAPGRERVKSQFGIHVTDSNKEVAQKAEVIILSVKPQFYADVIQDIKDEIKDNQIIITIAPGKTLSWLEEQFGKQVKIVRTMPNTPAMVGEGMTAACPNAYVTEDEKKYAGMGVSACATCDGFFYRKKTVAVVGGGDTACEEAIYLAGLAKQVYLVVRKPYLRASKIMQERVLNHPHIQVLFEHNAVGLYGENGVEGMHVVKRMGEPDEERYDVPIDGFFLAIGHKPNSDIFKPWVKTDETGYILTEAGTPRTGIPGVFAAGDVADPHYRQAITAAGSGCKAAIEAERYLSANGML